MARPRGAKNRKTVVTTVATERHTVSVSEQGKKVKRTTLELVLLMLRNKALQGDLRSMRFIEKLEQRLVPMASHGKVGVLIAPKIETPEEWEARVYKQQAKYRTDEYMNGPSDPSTTQT